MHSFTSAREGKALWNFAEVVKKIVGLSVLQGLEYVDYGCWCGYGGRGMTVDATDMYVFYGP